MTVTDIAGPSILGGSAEGRNLGKSGCRIPMVFPMGGVSKTCLDGRTHIVDTTTGEVLGPLVRERRSVVESRPEGGAGKRRTLPAARGRGTTTPRAKRGDGTRKGIHGRRRDLRDGLWARTQNVGRELMLAGHLVPDGCGGFSLRELSQDDQIPDHIARLCQVYTWLSTAWKEVGRCCTHPVKAHVEVQEKPNGGHCLGGLAHCDRYLCPICAPARAADNREKLLQVLDQIPGDAQLVLKVFTSRHRLGRNLALTEREQRDALASLYGRRKMKAVTYGNVKTLEITWGDNGFHPHRNVLEAYRPDVDLEKQAAWEADVWAREIAKAGGTVDMEKQTDWFRVIKRQDIVKVLMYIAKDGTVDKDEKPSTWTKVETEELVDMLAESISFELTGAHRKRGKRTIPITEAPPDAFAEAWCLKHLTWFSRSGCFLPGESAPADDVAEDGPVEHESVGQTVAWISAGTWRALGVDGRWAVARLVEEAFSPDGFLGLFLARGFLGGFGLGPPPEPDGFTRDDGEEPD